MEKLLLSKSINTLRAYLLKKGFFEHHLYSAVPYKIESTDTFQLNANLYLRVNPEPDIWNIGIEYEKFFFLGSLFRNESELDDLHQYEFTVLDIYLAQSREKEVLSLFKKLLVTLEKVLNFQGLSHLPIKRISHEEFNRVPIRTASPTWFVVIDYPNDESFYDTASIKEKTRKFELFYVDRTQSIEVVACGELGDNVNKTMYVKNTSPQLPASIKEKKYVGFGIGLERLLFIYTTILKNRIY